MLAHERNRSSRHEVETLWSLADLARANLALDVLEEAELRQRLKAQQASQMKSLNRKSR